jgi:hypothetical protein
VRKYDRELFAERNGSGAICIMRRNFRQYPALVGRDHVIYSFTARPDFVLALTDNWTITGTPVDWGADIVCQKLRGFDIWSDPDLLDKIDQENDKVDASINRDRMNKHEDYLKDHAKQIQKAWSDVRYANLDMSDKKRRIRDKNKEIKGA